MIKLVTDQNEYTLAWEQKNMDLLQSWQWGEIKRPEFEPIRLIINDIPVTILVKKVKILGLFSLQYGYMPRAFHERAFSHEDLVELVDYCKKNFKLAYLIVDPNLTHLRSEFWAEYNNAFLDAGFEPNDTSLQPNQTCIIDLKESEEQLWLDMRPSTRRNINKAIKQGCKAQTFSNGEEALERFFQINKQVNAEARIKYTAYDFDYYRKVWAELSKSNMARIYIITLADQDVGAYFVAFTKTKLSELYGGVNKLGKSVRAGHFIKWHSILEAKKLGIRDYDQWGVAPILKSTAPSNVPRLSNELLTADFDPKDKLAYISEFKFSFGGSYIQFMPQELYVFNNTKHLLSKFLKKINNQH